MKIKKIYKEKRRLLYSMYKKCRKYKKEIYNCFIYEKKKKVLAYKLLLNPITSKLAFIYFSDKVWKQKNK